MEISQIKVHAQAWGQIPGRHEQQLVLQTAVKMSYCLLLWRVEGVADMMRWQTDAAWKFAAMQQLRQNYENASQTS